jgi:hypothetical protein
MPFICVVSIPLCYIKFRSYTLSNTTHWMLTHFNTYFIILVTCFGYVITIIRPTQTVELALDAALSGMKHLLFTSIIKAICLAMFYYTNPLLLTVISILIHTFLICVHFFRKQLGQKNKAFVYLKKIELTAQHMVE